MSYGFQKFTYSLPDSLTHIEELTSEVNLSKEILSNMKDGGLEYIPICKTNIEELIIQAIDKLEIKSIKDQVGAVIYAQSIPFKVDLFGDLPSTTISGQPCSVFHLALKLSSTLLRLLDNNKSILIIGADKLVTTKERLFFNSAMGDVAIAGLLNKTKVTHKVLSIHSDSYIFAANGELSKESEILQFRESNPLLIRKNIKENLHMAKLHLNNIKYIFPHTPYLKIWDVMASLLKYPRDKIITHNIKKTGHLNSNDSFFHYLKAIEKNMLKKGDIVLLVNPGFGGSRGSTIIEYLG